MRGAAGEDLIVGDDGRDRIGSSEVEGTIAYSAAWAPTASRGTTVPTAWMAGRVSTTSTEETATTCARMERRSIPADGGSSVRG
jgi:hypothetical protein